jgi:hypothetical protein
MENKFIHSILSKTYSSDDWKEGTEKLTKEMRGELKQSVNLC